MAVRLSNLKIHLSNPNIVLLRPENANFLNGYQVELSFGDLWNGWLMIGKLLIFLGLAQLILASIPLLSDWVWGSPLVKEVRGVMDGRNGDAINYHYTVYGVRYDKKERSRVDSDNRQPGELISVLYLRLAPSQSKISSNVNPPGLFSVALELLSQMFLPLFGYSILNTHRRLTRIRNEATHIIEGMINYDLADHNYYYCAVSPVTGKTIYGSVDHKLSGIDYKRIRKGAIVAILYLDDRRHAPL